MSTIGMKQLCSAGLAAALLCCMPGESRAFWNWFRGCCGTPAPVVAPAVAVVPTCNPCQQVACAPCNPCGVSCNPCQQSVACVPSCDPCQQTVAYVPQTSYRVQYVSMPVTTYRPVSGCTSCSGMQTTYMQPVTAYQTQARMVPYTSYRLAYSASLPVASTSYYAPATTVSYAPSATVAPANCYGPAATPYPAGAAPATSTYATPSYPNSAPAATYPQNGYTAQPTPATAAPSLPATPQGGSQQTFAPQNNPAPNHVYPNQNLPQAPIEDERLKAIPDNRTNDPSGDINPGPTSGPTLPNSRMTQMGATDRWAYRPVQQRTVQPIVSTPATQPTFQTAVDDGGWRPAR